MKRYQENDYYFILNRCKVDDRGEYIIRAENSYGFREEPVFLNVQSKFYKSLDKNYHMSLFYNKVKLVKILQYFLNHSLNYSD